MKFILMLLLSSQAIHAQEADYRLKPMNLRAKDGFYYSAKTGAKFIISTESFKTREEAKAFCDKHLMPMAGEFELMFVSTSAAEQDPSFVKKFSFTAKKGEESLSGIWTWHAEKDPQGDVALIREGAGFNTRIIKLSETDTKSLPAVCADLPAMDDISVEDSEREFIPEKASPKKSSPPTKSSTAKKL